jgi:hypothetical protein
MSFSSQTSSKATEDIGIERRRTNRISVSWPAWYFAEGTDRCEASVVDVSDGGFGLYSSGLELAVADVIYVEFDQIGTFVCRLAWRKGNRFGVQIIDGQNPLDPDRERLFVAALKKLEQN